MRKQKQNKEVKRQAQISSKPVASPPGDEVVPIEGATRTRGLFNLEPEERASIWLILAVKFLLLLFGASSYHVLENKAVGGIYGALELWIRWDAAHYLTLARDGYQATGEARFLLVFYPLYPWLTRFIALIARDYLVSAFIVSTIASVAAGLFLYRLVKLDYASEISSRAVWFLLIFPTSYFLHIPYTESLFLALVLGAFLAWRTKHFALAGLLGASACLTRTNGLLLIPAFAVAIIWQYRVTRRIERGWLWLTVVPFGFAGYLLLNKTVTGNAFAFSALMREHWFKSLTPFWTGINGKIGALNGGASSAEMVGAQELIFIALGLTCTVACLMKKMRPEYVVWMVGNWLLITSTSFVLSVPRYTLTMFPIFILFAMLGERRIWYNLITVWSLIYFALFASVFVRGHWAF